ncbi:MAG: hypothetical protein ACKOX3_09005 [Bacteroidota bacterium]
MNHDEELNVRLQRALELSAQGLDSKQIYHQIKNEIIQDSSGIVNEGVLAEAMVKLNLEICKKRRNKGMTLVVAGVFFIITGFVMSVILVQQGGSIDLFMYGFTIFGILLVGWGGYEVIN